jgi:hypothetical protein
MKIDTTIIKGSIDPHDLDVLEGALGEIQLLIENNPFGAKMCFLLTQQHLGQKPVSNNCGEVSAPNCIGTAFFIAGVGQKNHPFHGYSFELNPFMKREGKKRGAHDFLFTHHECRVPGAFIFSYCVRGDDWHAGIYLGEVNGEHIAFAQYGHGGMFGPQLISKHYSRPDYYIPPTLPKVHKDRKPVG